MRGATTVWSGGWAVSTCVVREGEVGRDDEYNFEFNGWRPAVAGRSIFREALFALGHVTVLVVLVKAGRRPLWTHSGV